MKKILVSLILVFSAFALYADFKVFFHSKHVMKKDNILLSDIVSFQGDADEINSLRSIKVPDYMLKDGFVDKKELSKLLKANTDQIFLIYGNAVRVLPNTKKYKKNTDPYIKKGDSVNIIIRRKSITIEMIGESCVNAYVGQKVIVKTKGNKRLRGTLKKGKIVEVVL